MPTLHDLGLRLRKRASTMHHNRDYAYLCALGATLLIDPNTVIDLHMDAFVEAYEAFHGYKCRDLIDLYIYVTKSPEIFSL